MDNSSSPLDTLRQLKEMLDAGALTPNEFEALKQRLVFNPGNAGASVPPTTDSAPPLPPPVAPVPPSPPAPASWVSTPPIDEGPVTVPLHSTLRDSIAAEGRLTEEAPLVPPAPGAAAAPFVPPSSYEVPTPPRPPVPTAEPVLPNEFPDEPVRPARSPLALILIIGGVLALLAVVAYLSFSGAPSEHLSSTSQTAADTATAPIETGPQAAPLPVTTTAPETVRVAPAHPAPRVLPSAPLVVRDSVATPATLPTDSSARL